MLVRYGGEEHAVEINEGWLIRCDQRAGLSWDQRLWSAEVELGQLPGIEASGGAARVQPARVRGRPDDVSFDERACGPRWRTGGTPVRWRVSLPMRPP